MSTTLHPELQALGPDQLDVLAEQDAVSAINFARQAASALGDFDAAAHKTGVFGREAQDMLRTATNLLDNVKRATERCEHTQTLANTKRQQDRDNRLADMLRQSADAEMMAEGLVS